MIIILIEAVTQSDQLLSVCVLHSMKANSRSICTCSVTFSFALHTVHANKCNAVFHFSQFCFIGSEFSLSRHLRGFCKKAFQEDRWLWFHQSLQTHQWVKSLLQLVNFIIFALQTDYLQQLLWNILNRPPLPPLPFVLNSNYGHYHDFVFSTSGWLGGGPIRDILVIRPILITHSLARPVHALNLDNTVNW